MNGSENKTKQLLQRLYYWTLNNQLEHERPKWLGQVKVHLADPMPAEPPLDLSQDTPADDGEPVDDDDVSRSKGGY